MSVVIRQLGASNEIELNLHGNTISIIKDYEIYISNAGWTSVTTKERLNCLLKKLDKGFIFQKKGNWYWNKTDENVIIDFSSNTFLPVENYLNYVLLGGHN
jgi:hypothetical protein